MSESAFFIIFLLKNRFFNLYDCHTDKNNKQKSPQSSNDDTGTATNRVTTLLYPFFAKRALLGANTPWRCNGRSRKDLQAKAFNPLLTK
jgi:hypothetical protein